MICTLVILALGKVQLVLIITIAMATKIFRGREMRLGARAESLAVLCPAFQREADSSCKTVKLLNALQTRELLMFCPRAPTVTENS